MQLSFNKKSVAIGIATLAIASMSAFDALAQTQRSVHTNKSVHANKHVSQVHYVHGSAHFSSSASSAGDYLASMGGESRWPEGHVIRVYVAPGKDCYPRMVANCFNQWSNATHGHIRWTMVHSPAEADYTITWTRRQHELSTGTEAGLTTTDTAVDDSTGREYIDHARTSILTKYDGKALCDAEVEKTVLHEVGHGLGLEGHSPNCCDIMYYAVSPKQTRLLSARDRNTICRLYGE